MNEEHSSFASRLPGPLRAITPDLRQVPGVKEVSKAADSALNAVGIVSPHGRRIAAYTGAGLLGVAGLVEWPIAVAGAAAVWLTQPRPEEDGHRDGSSGQHTPATKAQAKSPAKSSPKSPAKAPAKTAAKSQSQTKSRTKTQSQSPSQSPSKAKAKPTTKSTAKDTGKATTSGGRSRTASGTKATKRQPARATAS
ncbi:hypothetical protein [Streptomyces ochraceiscleroticus]|uniref:Uncharacterized protein n=1 Tax=Streptomyces ochraceiscleroticus TaxID=47761 RepID=A0ABW1MRN7_9ACTN|nr:hypothetical protein [Streptomyces ochraceiscleroticus]